MLYHHLMKVCRRCKEEKSRDEFGKSTHFSDGLQGECIPCRKIINQNKREYRKRTPGKRKNEHLTYLYKITMAQYNEMLESQNGKCRICKRKDDDGKMLSVDHDHECCPGRRSCGKCIRGLLCQRCNLIIGLVGDDASVLASAAEYLTP